MTALAAIMAAASAPAIRAPSIDWLALGPVIALVAAGVAIVLTRALLRARPIVFPVCVGLALAGVLVAGGFEAWSWFEVGDRGPFTTIGGMVRMDRFGVFLAVVVLAATLLVLMLSIAYLRRESLDAPEYLALLLLSASGMLVMTSANDLIVVFLALELLSIPLYVLSAFDRRRAESQESGLKYFVLGAFSSAVFLYGVALTYGATGTTSLTGIHQFLADNTLFDQGTLLAGLALLLVGLGFKVAAVPFHMWTPDVYQGAPTPITAFMSAATKAAGFAALLRVFLVAFPLYEKDWQPAAFALALLSLAVGSVAAAVQTDVKRILAYSSIAHAGYVLMAFQVSTSRGREAALLYLFVYGFMAVGAFAVITIATRRGDDAHSLDDYRGLALRRPVVGGLLIFFVLAQAGVPLTGGFVAKLEVFSAVAEAEDYTLLVAGVLAAVVTAFFYLRIARAMLSPAEPVAGTDPDAGPARPVDGWSAAALATCAAATLVIGVWAAPFVDWARDATLALH